MSKAPARQGRHQRRRQKGLISYEGKLLIMLLTALTAYGALILALALAP